jgi:TATA-binding protein-associated factor Taf7
MEKLRQHIEHYRLQLAELIEQEGNLLEPEVLAKSRQLDKALNEFMKVRSLNQVW